MVGVIGGGDEHGHNAKLCQGGRWTPTRFKTIVSEVWVWFRKWENLRCPAHSHRRAFPGGDGSKNRKMRGNNKSRPTKVESQGQTHCIDPCKGGENSRGGASKKGIADEWTKPWELQVGLGEKSGAWRGGEMETRKKQNHKTGGKTTTRYVTL